MKKLFLIIVFLTSGKCFAQLPVDSTTNMIVYSEVIKIDSANANTLYTRAKQWFASAYNSSKSVIQNDDKETYTLFGKAIIPITYTMMGSSSEMGNVKYEITVSCKDERFKYSITNFYYEGQYSQGSFEEMKGPKNGYRQKDWDRAHDQVDVTIMALIANLKTAMNKKLIASSDW